MASLNNADLALLQAKFVVPLAVRDMLRGLEPLDDVAEYSINDIIGDMQPDAALLCVALCTQYVAAHAAHSPLGKTLMGVADNAIAEYGPLWLAQSQGRGAGLDDEKVARALVNIPEDLEAMGDLLLALCGELEEEHAIPAILCDILGAQAHMHMEFAEMQLERFHLLDREVPETPVQDDNVVSFPQFRRAATTRKI